MTWLTAVTCWDWVQSQQARQAVSGRGADARAVAFLLLRHTLARTWNGWQQELIFLLGTGKSR